MAAASDTQIAAYAAYNKMWRERRTVPLVQGVIQDHNKEKFQLLYAIDRFFGTSEGFVYQEVLQLDKDGKPALAFNGKQIVNKVISDAYPNVFAKLQELGLMLCGGAINATFTNGTINDLDFYLSDATKKAEAEAFLTQFFPIEKMSSLNAVTMKRKSDKSQKKWVVQLITRFAGEPQKIFDWFDFTITHGAYDFRDNLFYFGERFLSDLSKRRLVYSGASMYPICAMYRTKKYVDRGYELPGATIMHIALSIVQLKIETYAELKEQLMGIDTMYLQGLLNAKAPDAPVNYGEFIYESFQIIDRITGMTVAEEDEDEA